MPKECVKYENTVFGAKLTNTTKIMVRPDNYLPSPLVQKLFTQYQLRVAFGSLPSTENRSCRRREGGCPESYDFD
jgi:hypothetical protein